MKKIRHLHLLYLLLLSILFSSCTDDKPIVADYSFEVAKDVKHSVNDFSKVEFSADSNLDLGFYEGEVWIKLEVVNREAPTSYMVLCNDLLNHNYRLYKLDKSTNSFKPHQQSSDHDKYDDRSFSFAKPNFKIDLTSSEKATFLITTTSDSRILQATPKLISLDRFYTIKQQMLIFDIVFYSSIGLLLLINIFYFRLIQSGIYYYYGAYIISGCLMYLFVEGRLYGLGMSNFLVDHLMFISIRVWILSSLLFTMKFLETRATNPKYYKFILVMLVITLGGTTVYQLAFYNFSISTLHQFENLVGFVWIVFSLTTVGIAYKKRKTQSIYYLISYSVFIFFVTLGLIDSHTTMLPGDPFSYFKIGTIFEFIGFTYFITILVKQKFAMHKKLEEELSENRKILASNTGLVGVFKLIENSFSNESDWEDFKERIKTLDPNFVASILAEHSGLTKSEIRLLTLIKVGYSQKEIAEILNIAPDSVKKARSRVRKKLNLDENKELNSYLKLF